MTDKEIMEKLFAEIIALKKHLKDRVDDNIFIAGEMFILDYLHNFIESMQEEPVSIWHDGCEIPESGANILMIRKDEEDSNYPPIAGCFHGTNLRLDGRNWGYYNGFCYNEIEPPLKWAYLDDILKLSNVERTGKDWKEPVSEELEVASKEWLRPQLDKSYANYGEAKMMELTHFDGYAMLDAIEFGAEWQKEQFEKNRLAACDKPPMKKY